MPRLKGISFETAIIERYRRRESSVEEALIEMYPVGVSVRRVEDITKTLWGSKVSPATISELNKKAYVHIEDWRNRPLQGSCYPYVYVDGIYLRHNWGERRLPLRTSPLRADFTQLRDLQINLRINLDSTDSGPFILIFNGYLFCSINSFESLDTQFACEALFFVYGFVFALIVGIYVYHLNSQCDESLGSPYFSAQNTDSPFELPLLLREKPRCAYAVRLDSKQSSVCQQHQNGHQIFQCSDR